MKLNHCWNQVLVVLIDEWVSPELISPMLCRQFIAVLLFRTLSPEATEVEKNSSSQKGIWEMGWGGGEFPSSFFIPVSFLTQFYSSLATSVDYLGEIS